MITSAADERIQEVRTTDHELLVAFVDGRTLSVPLVWYPRLFRASPEQRSEWRLIGDGDGVHWPQIDEDLSAAGLLRGVSAPAVRQAPDATDTSQLEGSGAQRSRTTDYTVYDPEGDKIGKVDDLFVDENDQPEYIGVKMGFLGTRSTLIPWQMVEVREGDSSLIVSADDEHVKNGPTFDDDKDITPEFENEVYSYYGLQQSGSAEDRGTYGEYSPGTTGESAGPGMAMGDTDSGEFREHPPAEEGVSGEGAEDLEDEDELRVQGTEKELAAGTREREAGQLKVRKRVRTDREQIDVPTRHEEVSVEWVAVEGEATEAQISEEEVVVPVTEEEVVTDKRAVAKEEVRIRKEAVQDTEVLEEEVRREEIEVEDDTERRSGL